MNDSDFVIAADGWTQVAPCGEFPHAGAGVTQVVDREACSRIVAEFDGRKVEPNFPGVLVDFDHFSLDAGKSSEAAGWITDVEARDDGLWAKVRWSDAGRAAVTGGRFRLVSPVFPAPADCEDLGGGRIRPVKLVSVALTNEPNIRGGRPIANRDPVGGKRSVAGSENKTANRANGANGKERGGDGVNGRERSTVNAQRSTLKGEAAGGPGAKRFVWRLGETESGGHCDECLKRSGQVKTLLEWLRAGAPPCRCKCSLAEVGADAGEAGGGRLANTGWTDEARAASLAVRQAKAASRSSGGKASGPAYDPRFGWLTTMSDGIATWQAYSPVRTDGDVVVSKRGVAQSGRDVFAWLNGGWRRIGSTDAVTVDADGNLRLNEKFGVNMVLGGADDLASGNSITGYGGFRGLYAMGGGMWALTGNNLVSLEDGRLWYQPRRASLPPGYAYGSAGAVANRWPNPEAWMASLAVRRAKAAARRAESAAKYGSYSGGQPVIRDFVADIEDAAADIDERNSGAVTLSAPDPVREKVAADQLAAVRRWAGHVEGVGEAIADFNALLASAGSAAGARAGASAPAGAASRAFGVGTRGASSVSARRGALSRAADAVRDWLSERPTGPGVYVRPAALDAIIARERGLLEEARGRGDYAIRKAIAAETLRRYGVSDPESALTPRSDRETFDGLRALYGGRPAQGKAAASAPASLGGLRREYGDALSEFMGPHKMGVLRYADVLKGFEREARIAAERAQSSLFKARAGELAARREFGAGSRECLDAKARAERAAEHAVAAEMNRRDSAAELAEFEGLIRGYREGLTKLADATRADLDLDALVREARARRVGTEIGGRRSEIGSAVGNRQSAVGREKAPDGGTMNGKGWEVLKCGSSKVLKLEDGEGRGAANRANGANGENSRGDAKTRRGESGSRQGQSAVGKGEAPDGATTNGYGSGTANRANGANGRERSTLNVQRSTLKGEAVDGGSTNGKMEALRKAVGGLENRWPNPEAWMASLAVRRAKASARRAAAVATSAGTSGGSAYLGPSVAERVRSDLAESFAEYEGRDVSVPTISDSAKVERRQAAYADAFRKWWGGVETTAGNIEAFNAFVASAGGALAAGAGAYSGAYPTAGNQALGKYYTATGRTPAYDGTGRVGAGVRVGRPPYAARRTSGRRVQMLGAGSGGTGTVARGMPTGPAPLAKFPAAVAGLLNLGLDPLNDPKTADDLAFRAAYEKHLDEIRGLGDAGLAAEGRDPLGYANGPAGEMSAGAPVTRTGLRMRGAKEAARALGILHGAYGAGGGAPELPEGLAEEYALGLAEGAAGYGYGVRVPADRVAVLRMARSFADTAAREEEGYAPDHLNDRFNLEKWESAAKWAARNLGVSGVPAPDAPDTRAQYSAESLMRTALDWFGGAMARGDRDGANAALAYMGDLLYSLSGDRRAVADAYSAEGAGDGDEDAPEVDARMPEFDGDGNEVGGESPFYEDSYADPHARMPWAQAEFGPIARRFRLPNRWSAAARAAARASRKANGWGGGGWSDAARAASLAVRRAKSAARKAAEAAQVAGPADQLPLAHPGFGAADDALEDYLKRKRRHEANEARKAADKARLQEERGERRRKRSSSLKEKSDEPGLREKFDRPGLREKFQEANEKTDRGRLKDKYAKSNPVVPAQGFSAPVKGAVFYYNGNFYDSEGNWVAKAKPSQKNGAVWQNGLWYDAASGKTLGRTVAAS